MCALRLRNSRIVRLVFWLISLVGGYWIYSAYENELLLIERDNAKLCVYRREIDSDLRQYVYEKGSSDAFYGDILAFALLRKGESEALKFEGVGVFPSYDDRFVVGVLINALDVEPPSSIRRSEFEGTGFDANRKVEFVPELGLFRLQDSSTKWGKEHWSFVDRDPRETVKLTWDELLDTHKFSCIQYGKGQPKDASCSRAIRLGNVVAGYNFSQQAIPLYKEIDALIVQRIEQFKKNCDLSRPAWL